MKKQGGIILIVAIMILSLLSLLVLSGMQNAFIYYKSLNQLIEKKQHVYELEFHALQLASKHWLYESRCVVAEQNTNKIVSMLRAERCILRKGNKTYSYLIEASGTFPCLQTILGKQRYSTEHWRINILTKSSVSALLQLRIARPIPLIPCPKSSVRYIPQKILSWRYLEGIS